MYKSADDCGKPIFASGPGHPPVVLPARGIDLLDVGVSPSPSRSSARRVCVSIFWLTPSTYRRGRGPGRVGFFLTEPLADTPLTIKHFPHWVSPCTDGRDIATLVRLVAEGRLHPEIGRVADWADASRAIVDVYERRVQSNAVLTIG